MNSEGGIHQNAGAVSFGGTQQTALAQFTVGDIGFGPSWGADDSMAASIIRLEQENQELRAEVALLREEQKILARAKAAVTEGGTGYSGVDRPEPSPHSCEGCGVAWADHLGISGTCKALQEALQTIESLRYQLCEDKCRDKAAADRGWANI